MKWLSNLKPKRSIKDWKRRDKIFFVASAYGCICGFT